MPIDPLSATALGAVSKWLYAKLGTSKEGSDASDTTTGRVMVAFVNERGELLQEALLATVPRVDEEVELIVLPRIDPATIPTVGMSNWGAFARLKSVAKIMVLGGDKQLDELVEKSVDGAELPDAQVISGKVQRVRWTAMVASTEHTVTGATVVLRLQDAAQ